MTSLAWNLLARALSLAACRAGVAGRSAAPAVSFIYRRCWTMAERLGLMQIDASELDALRDAARRPDRRRQPSDDARCARSIVARLPRGVCVMKAELMRNVFLGGGARLAQYIRNDVGRGMVRDAVATLARRQPARPLSRRARARWPRR